MLYIIAFLLFILVIANETARSLLIVLLAGALILAIAGVAIFAIIIFIVWLFSLDMSFNVPKIVQNIFIYSVLIGGPAAIAYDQYKMRKK